MLTRLMKIKFRCQLILVVPKLLLVCTPRFEYNEKRKVLKTCFYIQRYNEDDFPVDKTLQALMNQEIETDPLAISEVEENGDEGEEKDE